MITDAQHEWLKSVFNIDVRTGSGEDTSEAVEAAPDGGYALHHEGAGDGGYAAHQPDVAAEGEDGYAKHLPDDGDEKDGADAAPKPAVKHPEVALDRTMADGSIALSKGAHYEGEHERMGWRAELNFKQRPGESDQDFKARIEEKREHYERLKDSKNQITRAFTDEERSQNTVRMNEDGDLTLPDGTVLTELPERMKADGMSEPELYLFAIDAETGDLVLNREGLLIVDRASGKEPNPPITFHQFMGMPPASKKLYQFQFNHHTTALSGADVRSAGTIGFEDGKISKITNDSGHYKPGFVHMLQAVEGLLRSGMLLDKSIVDADGKPLEEVAPKAAALYTKMQPLLAKLPEMKSELQRVLDRLDAGKMEEAEEGPLKATSARLQKQITTLGKGIAMLRKLGAGAANKIVDADVELILAATGEDGAAFKAAKRTETTVTDMLMDRDDVLSGKTAEDHEEAGTASRADLMADIRKNRIEPTHQGQVPEFDRDALEEQADSILVELEGRPGQLGRERAAPPVMESEGPKEAIAPAGEAYTRFVESDDTPADGYDDPFDGNAAGVPEGYDAVPNAIKDGAGKSTDKE